MRNLFLALVLANLAFAAWHAWLAPADDGRAADPGAPPIKLVSEIGDEAAGAERAPGTGPSGAVVPASAEPRLAEDGSEPADPPAESLERPPPAADGLPSRGDLAAGAPSPPARPAAAAADVLADPGAPTGGGAVAALRCVSVGPFSELPEAVTASAKLRTAGYDPTQRVAEGDIWVGYWVYIERIPSRAAANDILAKLHDGGVADAYLIPGEEDGDIISLGVFSEITRAGRLREQVRELGYDPAVVDRTRRATVYWVDLMLGAAEQLDFEALQTPGRITRLEQRPCGG